MILISFAVRLIVFYSNFMLNYITACCYKDSCEVLCCAQDCCMAFGEDSLGFGIVTNERNKECCALGLGCYRLALKQPEVLYGAARQCMCCVSQESLPLNEKYLSQCVCAFLGLSVYPTCGCFDPLPYSVRIDKFSESINSNAPVSNVVNRKA